jgi:hypothetical protein
MSAKRAICWWRTLYKSFVLHSVGYSGDLISGCRWKTDDENTPDNVHVLKCETCGRYDVAWSWGSLARVK